MFRSVPDQSAKPSGSKSHHQAGTKSMRRNLLILTLTYLSVFSNTNDEILKQFFWLSKKRKSVSLSPCPNPIHVIELEEHLSDARWFHTWRHSHDPYPCVDSGDPAVARFGRFR